MRRGTALVTGGGGAIAEQVAVRLAARGYDLVLADLDEDRARRVADRVGGARTLRCDLSTPAGIGALAQVVEHDLPDLTLLVNNAGWIEPGDVTDLPPVDLERHLAVNLLAPMQLTRAAGRAMAARGGGDVLAIVSMGGIVALRGSASYSASKFGLRGFHTAVRSELAPHGVRVMGVFPSGVDTPMLRKEALHPGGSPLNFVGTVLTVQDVADACVRALDTGRLETYVPYTDSLTGRLVGAFPWLTQRVEPWLARVGERGRARYVARHGLLDGATPP